MIKGAIFDVDGTLLDSMGIWKDVGVRYLNSIGIEAEPDLGNILFTMSIQEGAQYVKEHYHLSQETDEIEQNVLDIISDYYKETAPLKSGAVELLEKLRNSNIPMTIASSNNKKEIEMAFERLEIAKYFDRIFTCEEAGAGKTKPDIYLQAAEYLGTRPERRWYSRMLSMQSALQKRQDSRLWESMMKQVRMIRKRFREKQTAIAENGGN